MLTKSDIIGVHGGHARFGAVGASGYLNEVKEDRKLKNSIISELKKMGYKPVDCSVKSASSASLCLHKILEKSIKKNTTTNFSLHLNAGGGKGIEIYLPRGASYTTRQNAEKFCKELSREFGFENRGVKGTGTWYVNKHLKDCYLIEVGFVDSKFDKAIYDKYGAKKIGKKIAHLMTKYL